MLAKKKIAKKKSANKVIKKIKKGTKSKKALNQKKPIKISTKKAKALPKPVTKPVTKPLKKSVQKIQINTVKALKSLPIQLLAPPDIQNNGDQILIKRRRRKTKKEVIVIKKFPYIELSTYPKHRVKNILVSQPNPVETEKNPYFDLAKKYNVNINFRQFIKVEGLNAQEFRAQRIDILEHGAVILTSKFAADHYFRICNEMRITVPESIKYFCINEQTAYYLQKHIQYRKRKIFFGHGTITDLVDVIKKNKNEKFLLPASDTQKEQIAELLDEVNISVTKAIFYKTVCADLSDLKSLAEYDLMVFFTPVGIKSLKHNFPNFKQGSTRIAAFGFATANMVKSLGYRLDINAPNIINQSMTGALDTYLKESNKK